MLQLLSFYAHNKSNATRDESFEIAQFQVAIATDFRALTCRVDASYIVLVGH
jgi:hypothetical protein